jgi:hypothetical protein
MATARQPEVPKSMPTNSGAAEAEAAKCFYPDSPRAARGDSQGKLSGLGGTQASLRCSATTVV